MIPIYRKSQIEEGLADSFKHRYRRKDVNITGLLLARPETKIAQEEVVPNLNHWHYRSDFYTEFFCVGFTPDAATSDAGQEVTRIDGIPWYFSTAAFNEMLRDIEDQTGWEYRSGCFLIIANSRYDASTERAWIDFRRAILVNIGTAVQSGAVTSADELAERLFSFAKRINEGQVTDPVWEFSDTVGAVIFKKSLIDYIVDLLPDPLKAGFRRAEHFVVRELSPQPLDA